jgi:hypothetical protein
LIKFGPKSARRHFGSRLIENFFRGLVAEIIIGAALGPDWQWCSGDCRGWDFERFGDTLILETNMRGRRLPGWTPSLMRADKS